MRTLVAFLLGALATLQVSAQRAPLSNSEIEAVMDLAKVSRFQSLFIEASGRFGAGFSVIVQGPIGRVLDLAREAHESYRPFDINAVSLDARARELTIFVVRHSDSHASIKNVVVMPVATTSREAAIQPIVSRSIAGTTLYVRDSLPRTWKPGWNTTLPGLSAVFRFSRETLPVGDFVVVVATGDGEERYAVKQKDRDRIR